MSDEPAHAGWITRLLTSQPRILLAVALVAGVALIVSFTFAGVTLTERQHSIQVTCDQVKKLRNDLVAVLATAQETSLRYGRPSQYTDAQETEREDRIRAFYAPQLARIRPTRCP